MHKTLKRNLAWSWITFSFLFFIIVKVCFVPQSFTYLLLLHLFVNDTVPCFSKPDLQSSHTL